MITTICMNPSFDKTVEVDALTLREVNRIRSARVDMGGKGLNVAVAARRLGMEAQCIGCMGEDSAAKLTAMMDKEGLRHHFLPIKGEVRTNLKVVSRDGSGVTEFNEPGAPVTEEDLTAFFALAKEACAGSDFTVLTGSIPPGCPEGVYRMLLEQLTDTRCILDATGAELRLGATAKPFLVKPNLTELEQTLGTQLRTLRSIRDAAMIFVAEGVTHVVVSMGGMGAMYVSAGKTLYAPALKVEVRSTVGAGDTMVAGLLYGLEHGDVAEAFRCGMAAGAASVMTEGTQLMRAEDFRSLLAQVKVQEV